jgi:hypothetical protein
VKSSITQRTRFFAAHRPDPPRWDVFYAVPEWSTPQLTDSGNSVIIFGRDRMLGVGVSRSGKTSHRFPESEEFRACPVGREGEDSLGSRQNNGRVNKPGKGGSTAG